MHDLSLNCHFNYSWIVSLPPGKLHRDFFMHHFIKYYYGHHKNIDNKTMNIKLKKYMNHIYLRLGKLLKVELGMFIWRLHTWNVQASGFSSSPLNLCLRKRSETIARDFKNTMNSKEKVNTAPLKWSQSCHVKGTALHALGLWNVYIEQNAPAWWLSWLERCSVYQKVAGSVPRQGVHGRQPINVSPSPFLSPPLSPFIVN